MQIKERKSERMNCKLENLTSVDLGAYLKYNAVDDLEMDKLTLVQSIYVFALMSMIIILIDK